MLDHDREWGWSETDIRLLDRTEQDDRLLVDGALGTAWSPHCARTQPAKLARGLARVVTGLGVEIFEQTPVTAIRPRSGSAPAAAETPYGTVRAASAMRATDGVAAPVAAPHPDC